MCYPGVAELFLILPISIFIFFYIWKYRYWQRKNVPYLRPSAPFGNLENPFGRRTKNLGLHLKCLYDEVRTKQWRHAGIFFFTKPVYLLADLDLISNVLTRDFENFADRGGSYYHGKCDPLGTHLLAVNSSEWKFLRSKIGPTFSHGRMKIVFPTLLKCSKVLQKAMAKHGEALDAETVAQQFSVAVAASCGFGLDAKTVKDRSGPFITYMQKHLSGGIWKNVKNWFAQYHPEMARSLGINAVSKDVSQFYLSIVNYVTTDREETGETRDDFLQLLIDSDNGTSEYLTLEQMAAQCFLFYLTELALLNSTLAFALYELAKNQEIQQNLREEIGYVSGKHYNQITYEAIDEMMYMGQVIDDSSSKLNPGYVPGEMYVYQIIPAGWNAGPVSCNDFVTVMADFKFDGQIFVSETLRKYPPIPFITRTCVENYRIPTTDNHTQCPDENCPGEDPVSVVIDKGTQVLVSTLGIHYDAQYYPNPEKFDPDRFNFTQRTQRNQHAYLPFGEGPRNCIGNHFAIMQLKVALTILLKDHNFTVNSKTQEPLEFTTDSNLLGSRGKIWLNIEKV